MTGARCIHCDHQFAVNPDGSYANVACPVCARADEYKVGLYHRGSDAPEDPTVGRALRKGDCITTQEHGRPSVHDQRRWTLLASPVRDADGYFHPQRVPARYVGPGFDPETGEPATVTRDVELHFTGFDIIGCGTVALVTG